MKKKVVVEEDDPLDEDWSEYITTLKFQRVKFILAPKDVTVTIRMPRALVETAKKVAEKKGIKYHKLMRDAIAHCVVNAA